MTRFVLQIVIAAGVSVLAFTLIGPTVYLLMAALVFTIAFAVVHANERAYRDGGLPIDEKLMQRTALDFLTQLGIVSFAAAFWPSLPVIFLRGERGKRDASDGESRRAAS